MRRYDAVCQCLLVSLLTVLSGRFPVSFLTLPHRLVLSHLCRSNLGKGKVCRVKITNYRKNGQTFQNLLSMRPVYDCDQIYRFVIGVQFVVENSTDLTRRLIQLDKLFHLLPSKIPLRSKPTARANGTDTGTVLCYAMLCPTTLLCSILFFFYLVFLIF
jgi:hypothetical protein